MTTERSWERVEECYFGNAGYPSHATYRVASDGGVQRLVEFGATTTANEIATSGTYRHVLPIVSEEIDRLNDVHVLLHVKGADQVTAWYRGWTDDLDEGSIRGYQRDLEDSLGGPTKTGWLEFIGEGVVRRI